MSARHRCPAHPDRVVACAGALGSRRRRGCREKQRRSRCARSRIWRTEEVQVSPDPPSDVKPQQAIEQYRRFLELQSKNEKMRTEAMRRLGDLQVEVDEAARAAGVDSGVEGLELKEAIKLYEGLLKTHPDYPRNDAVMYQLSRAHEAQAKPEKALAVLDQLVAKYPQSQWYTEAQFRRGEILFSAGRYHDAELRLRRGRQGRSGRRLLRAGPVQARLVAVQAGPRRRERRVVPQGARSRRWCATASCAIAIR